MTTAPETTWDGLEIAADNPRGATIVVRRPAAADDFEYLLLHRAQQGRDYEGPWAWTPPAGARQPGEAVLPAALRELAEEAGIEDAEIHPVDLSDGWARFYAHVPADAPITLVDVEHDAYQWVTPQRAGRLCRPSMVARQVPIVDTIPHVTFTFRPLALSDLPDLLTWRAQPHVARWFGAPPDQAAAYAKYAPRIDGTDPCRVHVLLADGRPIGYAQHHPQPGYADAVGIDYVMGDPDLVGRGLGASMLWAFLRQVVIPAHPSASAVMASPVVDHVTSIQVLSKAGFRQVRTVDGEDGPERLCVLDIAHWFG